MFRTRLSSILEKKWLGIIYLEVPYIYIYFAIFREQLRNIVESGFDICQRSELRS